MPINKENKKLLDKKYYQEHKQKIRDMNKAWKLNNPNYQKEYNKRYYKKNKIRLDNKNKEWKLNHPEEYKKYHTWYFQEHKIEMENNNNQWRKKHPEKARAWNSDYKKRKSYCELCGSKDKLQFHHTNYIERKGYTVCFRCHRDKIHNKRYREVNYAI